MGYMLTIRRKKQSVADAVLEKEKDKPIGQVFDGRFSWAALLDALADVYLGVRLSQSKVSVLELILNSSHSGPSSLVSVSQSGTSHSGIWVFLGSKLRLCRLSRHSFLVLDH
jgi:hypothetical protein